MLWLCMNVQAHGVAQSPVFEGKALWQPHLTTEDKPRPVGTHTLSTIFGQLSLSVKRKEQQQKLR
jgi:hypothetical protein